MTSSTSGVGSKKRSYYATFKLEVVKYAEEHSKAKAARVYKVDRRRIVEWCQSKEKLLTCPNDRLRMAGGGKKPLMAGVEVELEEWMRERRREGQKVTMKMLMAEAGRRAQERGIEFRGSRGWLYNFTKRHDIKFRGAPTETESPTKQSLRSTAATETSDCVAEGLHVNQPENEVQILGQQEEVYSSSRTRSAPEGRQRLENAIQTLERLRGTPDTAAPDESGTIPPHAKEVAVVVSEKTKDRSQSLPPQRQKRPSRKRSRSQSSLSQDVGDSLAAEKRTDKRKKSARSVADTDNSGSKPQETSQKRSAPRQTSGRPQSDPNSKSDNSQKPKEPQTRSRSSSKSKNQRQKAGPAIIVEVLPVKPSDVAPPPAVAESTSTVDITPAPEPLAPQPQPAQDTAMKQWQESREQDTFVVVVDKMDDDDT